MRSFRRIYNRITAFVIATAILLGSLSAAAPLQVRAAGKKLTLSTARALAVANSEKYDSIEYKILTTEAKYASAQKAVVEKRRNLRTFRWSPLLSFKFPQTPDFAEEMEFVFKPLNIQYQLFSLRHQLKDQKFEDKQKVNNLYVEIVVHQKKIEFNKERLKAAEETLQKNRARLATGEAKQSDITNMEKNITKINQSIATEERELSSSLKKMSDIIGMDVTTGYTFEDPFVNADIPRTSLDTIKKYTLDWNQTYYDASLDEQRTKLTIETDFNLMRNWYGSQVNMISGYINTLKAGGKVSKTAFKRAYDNFLVKIDSKWKGKIRIIFFSFTKEWFKGSLDGIRYIEDDPYATYDAALDYSDALKTKNSTKKDIEMQVEDAFDGYVAVRNAYDINVQEIADLEKKVNTQRIQNLMGELDYEEYASTVKEYEDRQNDLFDSMQQLSQTLYDFDRLTCGGVSDMLYGAGAEAKAGQSGQSYVDEETAKGAYYYIEPIIQEQQFRLGVSFPDDYPVKVTHYELWVDNVRIGNKTPVDGTIRHLAVVNNKVNEAKLRFYNGNIFLDDVVIDPMTTSGPINIVAKREVITPGPVEVGSFKSSISEISGIMTITLEPNKSENIAKYTIKTSGGKVVNAEEHIDIKKPFKHLSLVDNSLSELVIEFFDAQDTLLYKGYFDRTNGRLMKLDEGN